MATKKSRKSIQGPVRPTAAKRPRGKTPGPTRSRAAARGGVDLPKFASEVSTNYARGVARAGGTVGQAVSGAVRGAQDVAGSAGRVLDQLGIGRAAVGIQNATKRGNRKSPDVLDRVLSGKK